MQVPSVDIRQDTTQKFPTKNNPTAKIYQHHHKQPPLQQQNMGLYGHTLCTRPMFKHKKTYVASRSSTPISRATEQSRTCLYPLKTRIPHNKKVVLYTGSNMLDFTAMMSI